MAAVPIECFTPPLPYLPTKVATRSAGCSATKLRDVLVAGCLATPHAAAPLLPSPRGLSAPSHSVELCKLYTPLVTGAPPRNDAARTAATRLAQHDEAEDAHDLRAPPGVPHCGPDWRGALREQSRYRVGVHDRMQFSAQACRAWAFAMQGKVSHSLPPTSSTCAAAVAATAVGTRRRPRTKCLKSKKKGKCDCSTKKCKKTRKRCKATS